MDAKTIDAARPAHMLGGDPPKLSITDDAFGLDRICGALVGLLANRVSADGYTIGIEGGWGSGKTSLTNFIVEELKTQSSLTLKIIRFEPWLIGKREALLSDLFRGLRAKIEEFRTDPLFEEKIVGEDRHLIDRLASTLAQYQALLEGASRGVLTITTVDPTHYTKPVALGLQVLNWLTTKVVTLSKSKTLILSRPSPLTLLYCWLQLGDADLLRRTIAAFTDSDEGLLAFLEGVRTWVSSSDRGLFRSLQSINVRNFLDLQETDDRVRALSISSLDESVKGHALALLDVWDRHMDR